MSKTETKVENHCFVVVGEVTPEQKAEFKKAWEEWQSTKGLNYLKIESTPLEVKPIVERRKSLKETEKVVEFLKNQNERENAIGFAKKLIEELKKVDGEHYSEDNFPHRKRWKNLTNLSWKQFNNTISTMELFGMIEYVPNAPDYFRIILSGDEVQKAEVKKIQSKIDELIEQIDFSRTAINDSETNKKLYNFKRKLSLKL